LVSFNSSRRLEVSRFELLLQVGTFCVAVGALVAGKDFGWFFDKVCAVGYMNPPIILTKFNLNYIH
jgi:hypothetical protein